MKIVKFRDEKYGIRRGNRFFGYSFVNYSGDYWFSQKNHVEENCHFSLEWANKLLEKLRKPEGMDYGEPVAKKISPQDRKMRAYLPSA